MQAVSLLWICIAWVKIVVVVVVVVVVYCMFWIRPLSLSEVESILVLLAEELSKSGVFGFHLNPT